MLQAARERLKNLIAGGAQPVDVDAAVSVSTRLRVLEEKTGIAWRLPPSSADLAKADAQKARAKADAARRANAIERAKRSRPLHAEIINLARVTLDLSANQRDQQAGEQAIDRLRRARDVLAGRA